ncbi:hypothetical protein P3607_11135 [Vibrio parahaemolyticus]|uniref:Uncharacterized protein n=1 Tax=Vibrio parahaemolyticus TaxID=670 RepID=A0A9Q3UA30_VIBPH|nr:hypothetical protein [Vibrio parahaemolyticus]EGQ9150172.1 hypothetical protein [Vibrio parahaemolyticus]MCC3804098.1 hypothetical protein [Vibrio parahaemolyticus]MDF4919597.1 hypothetical protein [Vibrio parahaemolyticus]MDG3056148.1 hypothetical protein [Vibrio parahaemolyticus]MDK9520131.1 hypothetical protein [Vibrio parahaemolyticus]
MEVPTRYGRLTVTLHAKERWQERTGRSLWELIGAVLKARRPTKNQLRRIMKKEKGWQPKRILECEHAYFLVRNNHIVTVYDKKQGVTFHD